MQTITFIGNGNMALSIAMGLKDRYNIEVVGRDMKRLEEFERALGVKSDKYLLKNFDINDKTIILCVKPNNLKSVGEQLRGGAKLLVSVLAGTTIDSLKDNIPSQSVVRAMPNLAASVGKSMTTITGDIGSKSTVDIILGAIGKTLWLDSEKEIDVATALAGSGPAYLALIAEALADGAVKEGLKREYAMSIMRGLFDGFGTLIQNTHPALLKDGVMSPAGTTAYGYSALEDGGVRASCMDAIKRACDRAKSL